MTDKMMRIIALGLIIDIILIDQLTKWAITELVLRPETGVNPIGLIEWIMNAPERLGFVSIPVIPHFNLTMVWNEGVSFGLLQGFGIWPLTLLALGISAIFIVWIFKSSTWAECIALAMIVGGAIGNVIDRLRFGAVADFFDVYAYGYHWPAFNIADACITIGVVILLIHGLFSKHEK
jgi:signal peptidase II